MAPTYIMERVFNSTLFIGVISAVLANLILIDILHFQGDLALTILVLVFIFLMVFTAVKSIFFLLLDVVRH